MDWLHLRSLLSFIAFHFAVVYVAVPVRAQPPNVILVLADDMGLGDLSCFNGGQSRTPFLDELKAKSLWFPNAYSASAVCAPARAALLTGRYPHRTGVVSLNMELDPSLTRLRRDETTMSEIFKENGYATGMIGKWHLGMGSEYHPMARGFQEFQGFIGHQSVPSYFNYQLDVQGNIEEYNDRYLTEDLASRAIDFVRRHQRTPFFLHLAHYAPHRPIGAPQARIQPYIDQGLPLETATVYAMIEIMDEGIGALLSELRILGIEKNTILIFASDNGPDPLVEERFNLHFRGTKYTVHEGGIRVPFLFCWPDQVMPGEHPRIIHFIDVLPTLVQACKLEIPSELKLDGVSFVPSEQEHSNELPPYYWQWNRGEPRYSHNAAVRAGPWKLVRPFVTRELPQGESHLPPLLFNLEDDAAEETDLSAFHPGRVRQMNELIETWCKSVEHDRMRAD